MISKDEIIKRFRYLFVFGLAISAITAIAGGLAYFIGYYTIIDDFNFRLEEQGFILLAIAAGHFVVWGCLWLEFRRAFSTSERDAQIVSRRYLQAIVVLTVTLVFALIAMTSSSRALQSNREDQRLAAKVMRDLHDFRARALQADLPQAAGMLWSVPSWTSPPEPLGELYRIQRTEVIRDVIAHLRTKTGEDLGPDPKAWTDKYCPIPPGIRPRRGRAAKE